MYSNRDRHSRGNKETGILSRASRDKRRDPMLEDYLIGNKTKILIQDMDLIRWRQDLEEDLALLAQLREEASKVEAAEDAKLSRLKEVIRDKAAQPINQGNRKAIIFTAFSDTAEYLYEHIAGWALSELGLHSALVTGSGTNQSTLKGIKKDLNNILTHFSPISKERAKIDPELYSALPTLSPLAWPTNESTRPTNPNG